MAHDNPKVAMKYRLAYVDDQTDFPKVYCWLNVYCPDSPSLPGNWIPF